MSMHPMQLGHATPHAETHTDTLAAMEPLAQGSVNSQPGTFSAYCILLPPLPRAWPSMVRNHA
eukprot:CAMPEP_0202925232 /NCGR_PEP_ID=MMETSP1392-20130828/79389_1 /ASSEMBLY_ACC=CAM_ASM_000868 /TAXON_ID=225041 /ORGANISM="Chlamydomonas chlamydogama, Strain SAG 11-48b" /LENGTH=62 /DNA_ID=CAMNT_0049618999 /DNA_START=204 /DNA_END=392 /DNA_ORIENTATION=-